MKRNLVLRLFVLIAIVFSTAPAMAQSTATLEGTVLDTQSAAVPGATVVVRNTATGVERMLVTDATGSCVAASLPPGPYRVEISLQGFQTQTRDVTLQVSQTRAARHPDGTRRVAEQVNVTAEAPVIDTPPYRWESSSTSAPFGRFPLNGGPARRPRCSRYRFRRTARSTSAICRATAVYGPGFRNVDLSITKNTPIGGTRRVQLRVEIFNLFNTANYGQPGRILTVPSTSFGVITNTRFPTGDSGSARQVQFAAKYLF